MVNVIPPRSGTAFALREGEGLKVRYIGRAPLPDTLVDRAQAVAEGTLQPDGTFEASLVQAKCASKYEAAYEEGKTAAE